jgi:hypothetical protein
VVGPVVKDGLEIDRRVAGQDALLAGLLEAFLDRGDEVARDGPAEDLVVELEVLAARQGLEFDPDVAELAAASGLLLVPALDVGPALDRLEVRDLGRLEVDVDVVALLQPLGDDADVELAVAGDEELGGVRVALDADRRVLLDDAVGGLGDAVLVGPSLGLRRWTAGET